MLCFASSKTNPYSFDAKSGSLIQNNQYAVPQETQSVSLHQQEDKLDDHTSGRKV